MCQTDWDARILSVFKNLSKAVIAMLLSSQIITLVPHQSSAQTSPNQDPLEDIPEEVLRAEIYTDARSPIDGKLLSAAEYTELLETLRSLDRIPPEDLVSPQIRQVVDLLKLRKFLRQFIPFIP